MTRERVRQGQFATGPDAFSDGGGTRVAEASEGRVEVIHGVYAHSLPLAGMTVLQARAELQDRMNIDPESLAVVDGVEVDDQTVLREGQVLNFVKPAGEKG
jgi:hypothetical protein